MTLPDRDTLARILTPYLFGAEWNALPAADAVLAHLTTTHPPTDTGLRAAVERLCDEADAPPEHTGSHVVSTEDLRATLAAPNPGPDQRRVEKAFRRGFEMGAWTVSDATGGSKRAQQAAAEPALRDKAWRDYQTEAAPDPGPDQADGACTLCGGSGQIDAEPSWSDLPVHDWQPCPRCSPARGRTDDGGRDRG